MAVVDTETLSKIEVVNAARRQWRGKDEAVIKDAYALQSVQIAYRENAEEGLSHFSTSPVLGPRK